MIDKDMKMVISDDQTDTCRIIIGIMIDHQEIIDLRLGIGQLKIGTNVQGLYPQIILMTEIELEEIVVPLTEIDVIPHIIMEIEIDLNLMIDNRDINQIDRIKINKGIDQDIIERIGVFQEIDTEQEKEADHLSEDDIRIHNIIRKDQQIEGIENRLKVDKHQGITV